MLSRMPLDVGAFVAIDLETTGSLPGRNSIIEVGAARIEAGVVTETLREFVRPDDALPPSVAQLTGISPEMLTEAPPIAEVMGRLRGFIGGSVVIAHNHRFDLGFLDYESERLFGESLARPVLDTLTIARRLEPRRERCNLRELALEYATTLPSHRALDDAIAAGEIFAAMVPRLVELGLRTAGDVAAFCGMKLQGTLAGKLVLSSDVPDVPGVFLFRDGTGTVLFVDRAKNLRTNVRAHFYARSHEGAPALETASVDWIECHSELDAVLVESRLLQRYHPAHNNAGERGRHPSILTTIPRSMYPALEVVERPEIGSWAVGPFTNRWAAETLADGLRTEFGLRRCVTRMPLRAPLLPCPHRAETSCPKPCVEDVDEAAYRERLASALAVFNGNSAELRERLEAARERAVAEERHDDAAHYRDVLRALDRSLSALALVRDEVTRRPFAVVEGTHERAVAHLLAGGFRRAVVRASRREMSDASFAAALRVAVARTLGTGVPDPLRLTRRQLRDLFLIRAYRDARSPAELSLPDDEGSACAAVAEAMRAVIDGPGSVDLAV